MSIPKTCNQHFWNGARPSYRQLIFAHPGLGLSLAIVAVASAWIAQILFWRLIGWEVSYRMDLFWVALPIGSYFFAAVASSGSTVEAYLCRSFPSWLPELGWVALTGVVIALGILNQSIILLCIAAGLFGACLSSIMRHARLFFNGGRRKIAMIGATFSGVAIGVVATSGNLFADQHLLQLDIALACCLAIAVSAMQLTNMRIRHDRDQSADLPDHAGQPRPADSMIQAVCGIMIAAPIAVAPTLDALCGIGLAGFSLGFMAHYGAMLLPSFLPPNGGPQLPAMRSPEHTWPA